MIVDLDELPSRAAAALRENAPRRYQRMVREADKTCYGLDGGTQTTLLRHALEARMPWAVQYLTRRFPGLLEHLARKEVDTLLNHMTVDGFKTFNTLGIGLNTDSDDSLAAIEEASKVYQACAKPILRHAPSAYQAAAPMEKAIAERDFAAIVALHATGAPLGNWHIVFCDTFNELDVFTHQLLARVGADYWVADEKGDYPIHKAVDGRGYFHLKGLEAIGADMCALDAHHQTPLDRFLGQHGTSPCAHLALLREHQRSTIGIDAQVAITRRLKSPGYSL